MLGPLLLQCLSDGFSQVSSFEVPVLWMYEKTNMPRVLHNLPLPDGQPAQHGMADVWVDRHFTSHGGRQHDLLFHTAPDGMSHAHAVGQLVADERLRAAEEGSEQRHPAGVAG